MLLIVIAQPRTQFDAWLHDVQKPARAATQQGARVFAEACASCHQIRGTSARGLVGPDLTHVASRTTLAAGAIPNDRAHLTDWLRDPQHIKPGSKMPQVPLSRSDLTAVVDYLEGLK
jgi:cytochrome c oxidase subunit 2